MTIYYVMAIIFILGVLMIAMEDILKINKAAVAVGMCIILWLLTFITAVSDFSNNLPPMFANFVEGFPNFAGMSFHDQVYRYMEVALTESLGDVATTLFFVLGSMAIIEILDSHGAFSAITQMIRTTNKRKLLWIFVFITFFLSAFLGNLATVIVMIAVMHKLIPEKRDRLIYACITIIAANTGGAWSPIGDVTSLLLWTGKNVTAVHLVTHVILPSLVMVTVATAITTLMFRKGEMVKPVVYESEINLPSYITPGFKKTLLIIGLLSLALVPVLQSIFNLPPFMGVLLGLVILWIITDIKSARSKDPNAIKMKVSTLLGNLDISTIFFFLGILMSVKALGIVGILAMLSEGLNAAFTNPDTIAFLLGICSSVLDNVALVAATIGMYPLQEIGAFATDSSFWTFLSYCCITGGSMLIIGSASGVTVMGLEKVSFGYYLKKFTPLAILGYCAGAVVYQLIC